MPGQILAICQHFASCQKMFYRFSLLATQPAFTNFVSTICSSIVITEAVFLGVRFFLSHKLQLSSCFRNITLCICLSRYSSLCFCSTLFFNLAFIALHVSFQSFSILSPFSKMQSSSKSKQSPLHALT